MDNKCTVKNISQALDEKFTPKSTNSITNATSGVTKAQFEPAKIVLPNNNTNVDDFCTWSSSITGHTSLNNLPEIPPLDRQNSHIPRMISTNSIDTIAVMECSNDKANAIRIATNRNINYPLCYWNICNWDNSASTTIVNLSYL